MKATASRSTVSEPPAAMAMLMRRCLRSTATRPWSAGFDAVSTTVPRSPTAYGIWYSFSVSTTSGSEPLGTTNSESPSGNPPVNPSVIVVVRSTSRPRLS